LNEKKLQEKYGKNVKIVKGLKKVKGITAVCVTQESKEESVREDFTLNFEKFE
jgi:hypothetical protein